MSSHVRRPKLSRKARQALDLEAGLAPVVAPARAPVVGLVAVVPAAAPAVVALAAEAALAAAEEVPAAAEEVPAAAGRVAKGYLDEMKCMATRERRITSLPWSGDRST